MITTPTVRLASTIQVFNTLGTMWRTMMRVLLMPHLGQPDEVALAQAEHFAADHAA